MKLKKINIDTNKELLEKSNGSFLPSKKEKTFDVYKFLKLQQQKEEVILFESIEKEQVIGYISVLIANNKEMAIGPMYVSDSQRGKGYGREQVELTIEWAKTNGFTKIKAQTWSGNQGSRNILESLGFNLIETTKETRINGDDTLKYNLNIT